MMVSQEYVNALVYFGSLAPANVTTLQARFSALFLEVDAGQGAVVMSVSVPGQSVTQSVPMTKLDQFAAYQQALDILAGNVATVTAAKFW